MKEIKWNTLKQLAHFSLKKKGVDKSYFDRLAFEIKEIEKQDATEYWIRLFNEKYKYETNKNGLVMPWATGMTKIDPMMSEHHIIHQTDYPDIDLDCVSEAREAIKAYAAKKYGSEYVCGVGAWSTYKFKLALTDATRALGGDVSATMALTKTLPDEVDELKDGGFAPCVLCDTKHNGIVCPKCDGKDTDGATIGQLMRDIPTLIEFGDKNPVILEQAIKLVGRIKTLSQHAGGLIISSIPLFGNVPMALSGPAGKKKWTSMWTEGLSDTQLSKFGYIKWDILGLSTLQYISDCCKLIAKTKGHKFATTPWARMNPHKNCAGYFTDECGVEHKIPMDDTLAIAMANDRRMETIFQFETDVQRGVLAHGVKSFNDLQIYNAMGHPGPIAMIPEYVRRRDNKTDRWKDGEQEDIADLLSDTLGIVVYQEQLQAMWQKFAHFTAPEAEAARKAVAKKWVEKLKPVKEQWLKGAEKTIGKKAAKDWWDKMEAFGRYAFNKSHSCAYVMIAYWCLWLKAHYPAEWWATVMSQCKVDKLPKYLVTARSEGVEFGSMDIENLTANFSVNPKTSVITLGLGSLKKVNKAAKKLEGKQTYTDIDDFVNRHGKQKIVMERLILLGAFTKYHKNIKATWMWYQYRYCTGKDITALKKRIREGLLGEKLLPENIEKERRRAAAAFKKLHPKRKIPKTILNYKPKPEDTRENIMTLFKDNDYSLQELLVFEKEFLGYYWHSPMGVYVHDGKHTIDHAKHHTSGNNAIDVVVDAIEIKKTKTGKTMARMAVTDGDDLATLIVWQDQLEDSHNKPRLEIGNGLKIRVSYDKNWNSFTMQRNTRVTQLPRTGK